MKRIVHCSGYTLAENPQLVDVVDPKGIPAERGRFGDWKHVCWGEASSNALGRIPMTIWLAHAIGADRIIWSTGCTKLADGTWEAEVFLNWALSAHDRLHADFPYRFRANDLGTKSHYRAWLERRSICDNEGTNTATSMEWLARWVRKNVTGPSMIYLVSSANHAPRVLRDAMIAFDHDYGRGDLEKRVTLLAVPAETNYGGKSVNDTIVRDLGD